MPKQKINPLLHSVSLYRVSFGSFSIVVNLHLPIPVVLVLIVFADHVAYQSKHLIELFVVSSTANFVLSEKPLKT